MKATGIVRRIDDLGRVVIPKEIRRTLHIREGDPLEIFTDQEGSVIFRKYSPMGDLQEFADRICQAVRDTTGYIAAVSDRDAVIAHCGGVGRELMDQHNSRELESLMEKRKDYRYCPGENHRRAVDSTEKYFLGAAAPVLCQGDLMGCVMLLMEDEHRLPGEGDSQVVRTLAGFLGRQMEG